VTADDDCQLSNSHGTLQHVMTANISSLVIDICSSYNIHNHNSNICQVAQNCEKQCNTPELCT